MTQQKSAAEETTRPTGTVCTESNLYKCTNGNFEIIQFVEAGKAFPNSPFGDARGTAAWKKVTVASDGSRVTFDGSKAALA